MRLIAAILTLTLALGSALRAESATVFAAASLKSVLDDIKPRFEAETNYDLTLVYAGSSALARQISQGAPADVFISANADWMDVLDASGHLQTGSRRDLLSNRLVVISPAPAEHIEMTPETFASARIAMGLTRAVPVGIYGREALEHLGLWEALSPMAVQTDNARAALALVARGEVRFGIVYRTDALAEPRVAIVHDIPPEAHSAIVYPMGLTSAHNAAAEAFAAYLQTDAARELFIEAGFEPLKVAEP